MPTAVGTYWLGESLYVRKNLSELTPNEHAERSMTKLSVLSQNMETPQRFDDVIQDQQKKLLDEKKKLLDEKPTTGRHAELLRKTLAPFGEVELGCWTQVAAPALPAIVS